MALTVKLPHFSARLFPLSIVIVYGLLDPARTLQISNRAETIQIFGGSLTEITCSATPVPVFRLVKEGREYDSYDLLPDLFDIEATLSGNVATLYINGTNRSNNVTVICRNIDVSSGQVEFKTLFTLMLEFMSTLPAPNNVHYIEDPAGHLQIVWEPPTLLSDGFGSQNVSIDPRITHFIINITVNESTTVYCNNASDTSFDFENDNSSCSLSFQVAALNPAGVGELSPLQIIDWCMDSTSVATAIELVPESSGLSAGVIAAVIAVAVLVIAALSVTLAAITYAKLKKDRDQHVIKGLKSELSVAPEVSDMKDTPPDEEEKYSVMAADHSGSGSVGKLNEDIDEEHASTKRGRCYSQDGPPTGVYYAEINVLTKKKNRVPEPSSEDTSHHVYAVLEKPAKNDTDQITDADQIDASDHSRPDSQKE